MTITVVRGDGEEPTHLVFEINADGEATATATHWSKATSAMVREIFERRRHPQEGELCAFLMRHRIRTGQGLFDVPGLDFCGTPGMSVSRIRAERDLARNIRDYPRRPPAGGLAARGGGAHPCPCRRHSRA